MKPIIALTIAGSDSGGGAGIQADLKTFSALGVYGTSAITAVTAQNTLGVQGYVELPPEFVGQQIDSVLSDIGAHGVKTGMVASAPIIRVIADRMVKHQVKNLVVDPVMVSATGHHLLAEDAKESLLTELFPLAYLVTPNLPEAEAITGDAIRTLKDMYAAGEKILKLGPANVLIKGGHLPGEDVIDLLMGSVGAYEFRASRIETTNTHGTGCTLSAAITAYLAKGEDLVAAVDQGKYYITRAIDSALDIGQGAGPTHHFWNLWRD
ncbi:MAG: bifunctional hydroxymethylpyrimidine kinase/phosphomethylpyrimidine kinase [Firmicutes bacterium]|nr:bifunctional hydroxymethylpyrimidine kinase/phosphomethylpyrimidine kinase [Bacillota bacterium]